MSLILFILFFPAKLTPFRVTVHFDSDEVLDIATGSKTSKVKSKLSLDEQTGYPSGTIGFGLYYAQST